MLFDHIFQIYSLVYEKITFKHTKQVIGVTILGDFSMTANLVYKLWFTG